MSKRRRNSIDYVIYRNRYIYALDYASLRMKSDPSHDIHVNEEQEEWEDKIENRRELAIRLGWNEHMDAIPDMHMYDMDDSISVLFKIYNDLDTLEAYASVFDVYIDGISITEGYVLSAYVRDYSIPSNKLYEATGFRIVDRKGVERSLEAVKQLLEDHGKKVAPMVFGNTRGYSWDSGTFQRRLYRR